MGAGIHKRGRIYWISYQDAEGKQRRESSHSTNKKVAERLLDLRRGAVVEDRLGLPRTQTPKLEEFAKQFLQGIAHERTRDRYEDSVGALLEFFGSTRIGDIKPEAIARFQQHRLQQGRKGATVNRDVSTLSGILRRAKKLRWIRSNPCEDIDHIREDQERRKAQPLSYEEEELLLACCEPLLRVFVIVLIETGLRPRREAAPLLWADVDLDTDTPTLLVRQSKTEAGLRRIPLSRRAVAELKQWRAFSGPDYSTYVFPAPRDPKKHWSVYQDSWERAIAKAKLSGRRVYDLRSTFATRAFSAYPNNLTVATSMGHSTPAILPTYAKTPDENVLEMIRRLERLRELHERTSVQ